MCVFVGRLTALQLAIGLLILVLHCVTTALNDEFRIQRAIYEDKPYYFRLWGTDDDDFMDHTATGVWVGILVSDTEEDALISKFEEPRLIAKMNR